MDYNEWIKSLYKETKEKWEAYKTENDNGYAIFYSPVSDVNKDILIIGYNPGGGINDFNPEQQKNAPDKHEYSDADYPLAFKMRERVFRAANICIEETVKLNLIFFRTKNTSIKIPQEFIDFSFEKTMEIIEILKPKIIVTEGFKTFDILIHLFKGEAYQHVSKITIKGIPYSKILKSGRINLFNHSVFITGLKHPSGGWGISDNELSIMGESIGSAFRHITQVPNGDIVIPRIAYHTDNSQVQKFIEDFSAKYNISTCKIDNKFDILEQDFNVLIADINTINKNKDLVNWLSQICKETYDCPSEMLSLEIENPICLSHTKPKSIEAIKLLRYFDVESSLTEEFLLQKLERCGHRISSIL